jgi:hypothetical protein
MHFLTRVVSLVLLLCTALVTPAPTSAQEAGADSTDAVGE